MCYSGTGLQLAAPGLWQCPSSFGDCKLERQPFWWGVLYAECATKLVSLGRRFWHGNGVLGKGRGHEPTSEPSYGITIQLASGGVT